MVDYRSEYPLEKAIADLKRDDCHVAETYQNSKGYVILWYDDKGCSVFECSRLGKGCSGIRTMMQAQEDFDKQVECLRMSR